MMEGFADAAASNEAAVREIGKRQLKRNTEGIVVNILIIAFSLFRWLVIGTDVSIALAMLLIWLFLQVVYRYLLANKANSKAVMTVRIIKDIAAAFSIFLMIIWLVSPSGIRSDSAWKYRLQKSWFGSHYVADVSGFPDKIPENADRYSLYGAPSSFGKNGCLSVVFHADEKTVADYESRYAPDAEYTFRLSELKDSTYSFSDAETGSNRTMFIPYDEDFWEDRENDAVVYVTMADFHSEHQHNMAVIIDKNSNMVEFVKAM